MNGLDINLIVERADRAWALHEQADQSEPDRLAAIARSVRDHVHLHVMDNLEVELGSTRALLGRLVNAVTGDWDPDEPAAPQVNAAIRDLRAVEAYLTSEAQMGAA